MFGRKAQPERSEDDTSQLHQLVRTQNHKIEALETQIDDFKQQLRLLKGRFDEFRDSTSDQLASLRGRLTASERYRKKDEPLEPASTSDLAQYVKGLNAEDRRLFELMLRNTSSPPTSGESKKAE